MKTILAQLILLTVAIAAGLAQQSTTEKHVKDIRAEQPQHVISANPLCQQVRAAGHSLDHRPDVDPSTALKVFDAEAASFDRLISKSETPASSRSPAFSPAGRGISRSATQRAPDP